VDHTRHMNKDAGEGSSAGKRPDHAAMENLGGKHWRGGNGEMSR
jgi:hypothetical protein